MAPELIFCDPVSDSNAFNPWPKLEMQIIAEMKDIDVKIVPSEAKKIISVFIAVMIEPLQRRYILLLR